MPKSYLRREAVIGAWQDEQSKVNRLTLWLYCMWPLFYLTNVGLNFLSARLSHWRSPTYQSPERLVR
jgi:hypothetical protein